MASVSEPENPSPSIYITEEWSEAAYSIAYSSSSSSYSSPPLIALICGPKNSGKTIFSRHLLNVLLSQRYKRVAYLNTDVGQPEFTPPGFLSLTIVDKPTRDLTIPCLRTPERRFFFGDISSKRHPTVLEQCVGYEILVDMIKHIAPIHVVKINISAQNKNLPAGPFWLAEDGDLTSSPIEIRSARQDYCSFIQIPTCLLQVQGCISPYMSANVLSPRYHIGK